MPQEGFERGQGRAGWWCWKDHRNAADRSGGRLKGDGEVVVKEALSFNLVLNQGRYIFNHRHLTPV